MKMNSVMIGSQDAAKLIDCYKKLFGTPVMEQDSFAGWQLGEGWVVVGPHDGVRGTNPQPGRLMYMLECEDVKADFERLRGAGAQVVKEPYQPEGGQGLIATLSDPDGNYFQLMSPMM